MKIIVLALAISSIAFANDQSSGVIDPDDVTAFKPKGGKLEARVLVSREQESQAALLLLSLAPRTDIPLHRHTSAEVLVVLDGSIRVNDLSGKKGESLKKDDVIYVPAGVAHGFSSISTKRPTKLLVLYAPPGPEEPFRGIKTQAFGTTVLAPDERSPDPRALLPLIEHTIGHKEYPLFEGRGGVRILFDADRSGDPSAYVGWLRFGEGVLVPEHVHDASVELLYITSGNGEMVIDGRAFPVSAGKAIHIPSGKKHSFKVTSGPVEGVQFYAPSGPEARFKVGAK